MKMLWLPTLILALAASACSFTALKRVPGDFKSGDDLDCTDGLTYPLIDMTGTVLSGVLAVALLSSDNQESLKTASYTSGALALGLASATLYGIFHVNRCRKTQTQEGFLRPALRNPDSDKEAPGTHGGTCLENNRCHGDFFCDVPMQVCLPRNTEESP